MRKLFRRTGAILLALCLLAGMLPTGVLADELEDIEYTASAFYGTYDGNPHSITLNVTTPGVSVLYEVNGVSSSTNPTFTDAGTYTVQFTLTREGFYPITDSRKVKIDKADVSNEIKLPSSFAYTGKPVKLSPSHSGITAWEISYSNTDGPIASAPSAPGKYGAKIIGSGPNHVATIYNHNFTIVQAAEEIEYSASGYRGVYDGNPHSITLNVATPGVSVSYATSADGPYSAANPRFTDAGTYTVYYKLEKEACETRTGSATVTIAQVDVSDRVSFNRQSVYPCTGAPVAFSPSCDNIARWVYTYYDKNGAELAQAPSAPGEYSVRIIGMGTNHFAKITHAYSIALTEIEYSVSGYSGYYDGKAHSIAVSVTTEGATVRYATSEDGAYTAENPSYTEPGTYTVWFRLEKENCETVVDSATVTIAELGKIEYSVENYSGCYDGKPHSITVSATTEGATVTYSISEDGTYTAENPAYTEPGTYTVWFRLEKENCETVVDSATVTIAELGKIEYSLENYSGYHDGKAHSITVSVTTEGATVTYSTSEDGAYSTENLAYTEPGKYTVWFKLEKVGYETVTGSATVTIAELGKIEYSVENYSGCYDGKAHSISVSVATEGATVSYATSEDGEYTAENPAFTEPGAYTVWYRIEKENCATITGSASVTITELGRIECSVSDYSGYYDGAAHTFDLVVSDGATVTYATTEDGAYSATKPSFTEPGSYTVWYKIEKENCATITGSASVTILELRQIQYSVSDYRGYYDGAAHTISLNVITEGVNVSYATYDGVYQETPIRYTDVGLYAVWFRLEKEGYETVIDFAEVNIAKPGTILYTVERYYDYYDGAAHTISLNVITEGVDVTYSVNGVESKTPPMFTDPGEYNVWFTLKKEGYETVTDYAAVTIMELRQIEYSVEDNHVYCDGGVYSILLRVTTAGVSATYATSEGGAYSADMPVFTDVGAYTVWFRLEKEGYETVTGSATVAIEEPGTILYTVTSYDGYYDGQPHTISLNVITEGVTVTYFVNGVGSETLPTFTKPDKYLVVIKLEKEGYKTEQHTIKVRIKPGVIEYSARGYSGYADGKAHSISLYVSTPDAKVSYATSEDGEYSAEKPSFSGVGTHTVWYRIEKEHYETVEGSEVVKLRQPKEDSIVYSVEDYVGAYDGEAHTIALDVSTPEVKASYATSESGAYGATLPTFTEPGTYTVWFRLEKSGYETSTGSATVTIEKAEQILYFEGTVRLVDPSKNSKTTYLYSSGLSHDKGDGALSWSCSDPDRIHLIGGDIRTGTLRFDVPYEEWSKGYSATITATAAETDHYKAATATCTIVASDNIKAEYSSDSGSRSAADVMHYISKQQVTNQMQETIQMQDIDLTVSPVSTLDNQSLLSASNELRKKLMASAGAGQIGSMAVDATLIDTQTGAELHSTNGDLTLSFTGSLAQSYKKNYKNMACVAVHLEQNSTDNSKYDTRTAYFKSNHSSSYSGGTTGTDASSPTATSDSTPAPQDTNVGGAGASSGSSGFTMAGGAIDTSGANPDGSGVYAGSSGLVMDGGTIVMTGANADGSGVNSDSSGIILIGGSVSMMTTNASDSTPAPQDTTAPDTTAAPDSTAAPQETNAPDMTVVTVSTAAPMYVNRSSTTFGSLKIGEGLYDTGNSSKGGVLDFTVSANEVNKKLLGTDNSNEEQLLVQRNDLTLVPVGSFSPTVEFTPCKLTESGVVISDTSLSPFLLIYGPKEAFSKLLTVRAKDGVFIYDGEGHAVAAEPSIAEGTSLYYSLDLENWQTEAPAFTDVLWNEDGSVGSYPVYVLADNPDCDPAVCSYTVTILPAQ